MNKSIVSTDHTHCKGIASVQLTVYTPDVYETVTKYSNNHKSFQHRRDKHVDLLSRAIRAPISLRKAAIPCMIGWVSTPKKASGHACLEVTIRGGLLPFSEKKNRLSCENPELCQA